VKSNFGSQLDLDNASNAVVTAKRARIPQASDFEFKDAVARNPDLRSNNFRPTRKPGGARQAERNLDHTVMRAPMACTGNAGRPDSARPLHRGWHTGILGHRYLETLGRRQSEGI